jgi:thiopeptide-type bacteriocin biosynthesis protein
MMGYDWLHYALYPGVGIRLEDVVCHVVAPAVARAKAVEPELRWFFLRYTDELGAHVRLRFAGSRTTVDAVYGEVDPVLRAGLAEVIESTRRDARTGAESNATGCYHGIYEPELDKYGGPVGVELAETVFQVSSEVTLALLTDPDGGVATHRRALALVLMRQAARATELDAGAEEFWQRYEWYWSGGTAGAARRSRYLELARERRARAVEQLDEVIRWPCLGPLLARYDDALHRYAAGPPPIPPADAVRHQVHLTNNRLGIPPAEEGFLARLLLTIDVEVAA